MMRRRLQSLNNVPPGLAEQRLTPQRVLLLNLLRQGGHLDADELHRRAKEKEPRLNLSTVYRNLRLFIKLRIVEEHHFGNAHSCYEATTETKHHHLVCLGCGKVVEFECPLSWEMKRGLEVRSGFHIIGTRVFLGGYCAECLARR